jgi:hypothetical protein
MKRRIVLLALALAGCGVAKDLRPEKGQALPPKPYGATVQPNAAALLTPTTQARPLRTDDLLTQSQERPSNAFDLPPP